MIHFPKQKKIAQGCEHGNSRAAVRNSAEMEGRPNQASGGDSLVTENTCIMHLILAHGDHIITWVQYHAAPIELLWKHCKMQGMQSKNKSSSLECFANYLSIGNMTKRF